MSRSDRVFSVVLAAIVAVALYVVSPYAALVYFLALIPAAIGRARGGGALNWWTFGVAIWPLALTWSFFARDHRPRCLWCDEIVRPRAIVCPHCRHAIDARTVAA